MKKKRVLTTVVAVAVAAVLLVVLLPTILSLAPVRAMVLKAAGAAVDGSVSVDAWSIGWFGGVSVHGLDFRNKQGTTVKIESIELTAGLLELLGSTNEFGELTVKKPDIVIVLPAAGHAAAGASGGGGRRSGDRPTTEPARRRRVGSDINAVGKVKVEGGCIRVVSAADGTSFEVDDLSADADVSDHSAGLDVVGKGLRFVRGNTNVIEESSVELRVAASLDSQADSARLELFRLISSAVTLSCTGTVTDLDASRVLDASGKLRCDFARISDILKVVEPGTDLEMEGNEERAFSAHLILGAGGWADVLRSAKAEARLYVKRVRRFGVDARDFDAILEVGGARAQATLKTSVNDGEVLVMPVVDVTGEKPFLRMPDDSQLLKGVRLTDAMVSELLTLIHPIFRKCAVVGGSVDMVMNEFGAPLDGSFRDRMALNGSVAFHDLELGPDGMLKELMEAAKLDVKKVAVPDQEIKFRGKDGRLVPSPLEIVASGHTIRLRGSVGFDKTLDYVAEVPVTPRMVGDKVYKYVKDASLEIHIGGTVAKPVISRESMDKTLANLVREASKNISGEDGKKLIDDLLKSDKKERRDLLKGLLKQIK